MKVLVVDDSKIVRYMLTKVLNELGYTDIVEADTVEKAIMRIHAMPPQLIFSDFNMPGKNGLELLKYVRSTPKLAGIPFVMVTTVHEKKVIMEAVREGLQYYLYKPVEKNIIMEKLQALADSHGIQPPICTSPQIPAAANQAPAVLLPNNTATPDADSELPEEIISEIITRFFLVFDGELTMPDFQAWLADNVAPIVPPSIRGRTPQQLMQLLRDVSADGLRRGLQSLR